MNSNSNYFWHLDNDSKVIKVVLKAVEFRAEQRDPVQRAFIDEFINRFPFFENQKGVTTIENDYKKKIRIRQIFRMFFRLFEEKKTWKRLRDGVGQVRMIDNSILLALKYSNDEIETHMHGDYKNMLIDFFDQELYALEFYNKLLGPKARRKFFHRIAENIHTFGELYPGFKDMLERCSLSEARINTKKMWADYCSFYTTPSNAFSFIDISKNSSEALLSLEHLHLGASQKAILEVHLGQTEDKKIFQYIVEEKKDYYPPTNVDEETFEKPHLVLISGNEKTISYNQHLKFTFFLSEKFYFHFSFSEIQDLGLMNIGKLKSLFVTCLSEKIRCKDAFDFYNSKEKKIYIILHNLLQKTGISVENEIFDESVIRIKNTFTKMISSTWEEALNYLGLKAENFSDQKQKALILGENFHLSNNFKISIYVNQTFNDNLDFSRAKNLKIFKKFTQKRNKKILVVKKMESQQETISDDSFYVQKIKKAWIKSQTIDFLPIGNEKISVNFFTKKFCSKYIIGKFFDNVVLKDLTSILKRWYSMTEKGIYITNINETLTKISYLIKKKEMELAKKLSYQDQYPSEASIGNYFTQKEVIMINSYSRKAWSFFVRHLKKIWLFQIRMRQYRCSEIFKEKILNLFLQEPLKWESGYTQAIRECEELFIKSAKGYQIPLINKTLFSAKNELLMVLKDYYADLKASPARELNSLDHIEKDVNKTGSKSSQMVVGFALTSAIRLRGYGNFQFVSSYAYGPHVFNFSCINDRSTLENETKGYVKPLRIQPSLNFDIRL